MSKRNIEAIYQLSPVQQGMLFHSLIAPDSGVYVEQTCCTLHGTLNLPAFEQAWRQVLDRHAVLRTSFAWEKLDQMLQVVQRQVELPFEHHDWRAFSDAEQQEQLEAFLAEDRKRGFNISKAPLLRLALVRIGPADGEEDYRFVFSHHHALLDGWSMPLLFQEVFAFYDAFRRGETLQLPPARPYRDYIAHLQKRDAGFVAAAEAWWRRVLDGFTAPTPLVVERLERPDLVNSRGYASQELALPAETSAALQTLARRRQLTPSAILQAAWAVLLGRYSGEADVLFGATVSGRPAELPGVETMIGMFINTLPVRASVQPATPVIELLKALQARQAELRQYECCSLTGIQAQSRIPRGQPLFESILVFENFPVARLGAEMDASLEGGRGGVTIRDVRIHEQTNYPLTVVASPGERLHLKITYDTSRFDDEMIGRMLGHLRTLLEGIAADPEGRIASLPMLTESERQALPQAGRAEEAALPAACVHQLFEEQAARTPDAAAIEYAGRTLSYQELNARANQLAHWLAKAGAGPETLVGLSVERSLEMVVAVLGVLKAGGAYVPMDPAYPTERLAFMLEDSKVSILLTQAHLKERLPAGNARRVCLDADWPEIARQESTNLITEVRPENLAYVIYTSGSTGKPKGALIEHRGVVNYLTWAIEAYRVAEGEGSIVHSSLSFDLTVTSLLAPLVAGKRVWLVREDLGVEALGEALREASDPSLVKITPAHLEMLGHQLKAEEAAGRTRRFIIGGENLLPEHIAFWREHAPETALINEYGPTETVVGCCVYEVKPGERFAGPLPIGRPIANTQLYVLDKHGQLAPVGVPGELYIGGAGVGRGYLNRPELTAERFIELRMEERGGKSEEGGAKREERGTQSQFSLLAPHSSLLAPRPSLRVYRTGDLVRWLPNGELQCLGRMDDQVKIRGYRIELGEIESALKQYAGVMDAAVIAREDAPGDRRLAAYVVAAAGGELAADDLNQCLASQLPDYMLPSAYVMLDAIPLTSNGKVDRRALPAPEAGRDARAPGKAPRTPAEELLAGIWSQVLRVERVGVEDDFFALGGHSLLATQLVSRVRDAFAVELPLRSLFENPTIAGMAAQVEALSIGEAGDSTPPIARASREGAPRLSFSQQRLWFLDQLEPGSAAYNNPAAVRLRGPLDAGVLERSLNEVVRRHEILRTRFAAAGGQPVQVIAPSLDVAIVVSDCADLDEARRLADAEAHRSFDLAAGPLLRVRLLRLAVDDHVLTVVMHHVISDGWSAGVLIGELASLYEAFAAGAPSPLAELPLQYADYAEWQREHLEGERLERQLDYWRNQLGAGDHTLALPYDRPRPAVQTDAGAEETFHLPSELVEELAKISRRENVTLFMTLMGAFQTLLHRYSGQAEINVGTPIANRTRSELEGLIGFFVNTLVIHADFSGDPSFRDFLRQVRETALGAYAHQDLPFEQLVEALQPRRDLSHSPLFQVMFMLHAAGRTTDTAGLEFSSFEIENRLARFDLTLELIEQEAGLGGVLTYNTDLFDAATIRRMIGHFERLLEAVAADSTQRVSQLPLLTEAERREMLIEWNETEAEFPADRCFHHLFEERAARQPENPATSFEGSRLSYRELNERANQLAHYLRSRGVGPETIVALCVERSLEMVVAQLGILKAGAAYLPLDPHYPAERLAFMFSDSEAPVLVSQSHLAQLVERLPAKSAHVIELDREWAQIAEEDTANPAIEMSPDNLAYVIYTSGTTGQPKGTLLEHRGLCNLALAQQRAFGVGAGKRVLQFAPFSFDASVWEMAMALASGAELVLTRQETLASADDLHRLLRRERITTATLPPSLLRLLSNEDLPELETLVAAGERCTWEIVARWSPGRWFFNAYGPTETTVCATMELCQERETGDPPIGRPLPNTLAFVLDKQGQPVPVGVPGELHIGGVSLARGYLRRPEMTAERFVDLRIEDRGSRIEEHSTDNSSILNPQSSIRLYKTGDLVRYRADGRIEYLGRMDEQVKIRGHRIELGEIEASLREYPEIREAAVAAIEDATGDKRLVGYFVTVNGGVPTASELRAHLRGRLPEFMTPSNFMRLERLPLSPSGKVDRAALPIPDGTRPTMDHEYVAPRTETEEQLAALWAELLGVERVGVEDNFFDLGGHSLLATQIVSRVREMMHVDLPLRALFECGNIAALAATIEEMREAEAAEAEEIARLLAQLEAMPDEEARVMVASGD